MKMGSMFCGGLALLVLCGAAGAADYGRLTKTSRVQTFRNDSATLPNRERSRVGSFTRTSSQVIGRPNVNSAVRTVTRKSAANRGLQKSSVISVRARGTAPESNVAAFEADPHLRGKR